ncbi:hypothetical protein [Geomobilimonas luticola]|nr:hypothetical protein [Geomobilimonas luticola]
MAAPQLNRMLERFARAARSHHNALESLDEVAANRQATVLAHLAAGILQERGDGVAGLVTLTREPDPVVAGMAAVYLLPSERDLALAVLRRVADEPGLIGFRARGAIDRLEKGEWDGEPHSSP